MSKSQYTETIDGINYLIKIKDRDLKIARRKIYKLNKRVKEMLKMAKEIAHIYPEVGISGTFTWFLQQDKNCSTATDPYMMLIYNQEENRYEIFMDSKHWHGTFTVSSGLFRTKISSKCLPIRTYEEFYNNFDAFEEFFYNKVNNVVINY